MAKYTLCTSLEKPLTEAELKQNARYVARKESITLLFMATTAVSLLWLMANFVVGMSRVFVSYHENGSIGEVYSSVLWAVLPLAFSLLGALISSCVSDVKLTSAQFLSDLEPLDPDQCKELLALVQDDPEIHGYVHAVNEQSRALVRADHQFIRYQLEQRALAAKQQFCKELHAI